MNDRIHRTVSEDGTEIVGHVYGEGPPVVLVHGNFGDGEMVWEDLLPLLSERLTCYVPSTRGRGLSGGHPDPSRRARVRDVTGFVDAIGEPVGLIGESMGGGLALGAAARSEAVSAVAVWEPVVFEVMDAELSERITEAAGRMAETAEQGDPAAAVAGFLEILGLANAEEQAFLAQHPEVLASLTNYLAQDIAEIQHDLAATGSDRPDPLGPPVLADITAPVLLMRGSRTALSEWFADAVRHVARHVADARVCEIPGAGHFGASGFTPEPIAHALIGFLTQSPAERRP